MGSTYRLCSRALFNTILCLGMHKFEVLFWAENLESYWHCDLMDRTNWEISCFLASCFWRFSWRDRAGEKAGENRSSSVGVLKLIRLARFVSLWVLCSLTHTSDLIAVSVVALVWEEQWYLATELILCFIVWWHKRDLRG